MKPISLFCLVAMMPAVLNGSAVSAHEPLAMLICTGDGSVQRVPLQVPSGSGTPGGREGSGCCVKGCHNGSSRKRSNLQLT